MNPLFSAMTPLERKYLKLYATAAKKDFELMRAAAFLMEPTELGISCPVRATRAAEQLLDMQAEFVGALTVVAQKHNMRRRSAPAQPTEKDILELMTASFFKMIAVINSVYFGNAQKDAGWFSGEATNWQTTLAALKTAWAPTKDDSFSSILSAFSQLFSKSQNNKLPFTNKYAPAQDDNEWPDGEDDDFFAPEEFD